MRIHHQPNEIYTVYVYIENDCFWYPLKIYSTKQSALKIYNSIKDHHVKICWSSYPFANDSLTIYEK